jgi:hypothetical protein
MHSYFLLSMTATISRCANCAQINLRRSAKKMNLVQSRSNKSNLPGSEAATLSQISGSTQPTEPEPKPSMLQGLARRIFSGKPAMTTTTPVRPRYVMQPPPMFDRNPPVPSVLEGEIRNFLLIRDLAASAATSRGFLHSADHTKAPDSVLSVDDQFRKVQHLAGKVFSRTALARAGSDQIEGLLKGAGTTVFDVDAPTWHLSFHGGSEAAVVLIFDDKSRHATAIPAADFLLWAKFAGGKV